MNPDEYGWLKRSTPSLKRFATARWDGISGTTDGWTVSTAPVDTPPPPPAPDYTEPVPEASFGKAVMEQWALARADWAYENPDAGELGIEMPASVGLNAVLPLIADEVLRQAEDQVYQLSVSAHTRYERGLQTAGASGTQHDLGVVRGIKSVQDRITELRKKGLFGE